LILVAQGRVGEAGGVLTSCKQWHMATNATYLDFVNFISMAFERDEGVWYFGGEMSHELGWLDPRWGDAVTEDHWDEVRDAWLQPSAILHLDLEHDLH
jgi:hypothetical protein